MFGVFQSGEEYDYKWANEWHHKYRAFKASILKTRDKLHCTFAQDIATFYHMMELKKRRLTSLRVSYFPCAISYSCTLCNTCNMYSNDHTQFLNKKKEIPLSDKWMFNSVGTQLNKTVSITMCILITLFAFALGPIGLVDPLTEYIVKAAPMTKYGSLHLISSSH